MHATVQVRVNRASQEARQNQTRNIKFDPQMHAIVQVMLNRFIVAAHVFLPSPRLKVDSQLAKSIISVANFSNAEIIQFYGNGELILYNVLVADSK